MLLNDMMTTLTFYDRISNDMREAFEGLTEFCDRLDEAERFDEAHLLPIALDIFGNEKLDVTSEYVAMRKTAKYDVPCKYVAKHPELTVEKKESQKKSDTPIRVLWKKRDDAIRKRKSRHKYSDAEFEAAKGYIMGCYEQAQTDFDYAAEQYEKDMELTAIDEYVRRVTDV